jgi:hypothetical protein
MSKNNCHKRLINYLRARYTQVQVTPRQGIFNHHCYFNTVEYAKKFKKANLLVFECIYIDEDYPVLHYVIKKGEEYLEVTLGHRAEHLEYYILREIPEKDWEFIEAEFHRAMGNWTKQFTTWFDRKILRIKRVL